MKGSLSSLPAGFFSKYYRSQNKEIKTALRRVLGVFSPVESTSSNTLSNKNEKSLNP